MKTLSTREAQRAATALRRESHRLTWIERGSALRVQRSQQRRNASSAGAQGPFRFDPEARPITQGWLLGALWTYQEATRTKPIIETAIGRLVVARNPLIGSAGGLLLRNRDQLPSGLRRRVASATQDLLDTVDSEAFEAAYPLIGSVHARRTPPTDELWSWYEREAADVYALLEMVLYRAPTLARERRPLKEARGLRVQDIPELLIRSSGAAVRQTIRAARFARKKLAEMKEEADQQVAAQNGQFPAPIVGMPEHGFIPRRLAQVVEEHPLNIDGLRVRLRGYQAFGARYALHLKRVLLGDEMGLGKTIVALAVMQHLANEEDAQHFLVVAPNSVLHNWAHEVTDRTAFEAHILHGSRLEAKTADWRDRGGVAITTFGTLRNIPHFGRVLPLAVIDEAHYVKNPNAQRTQEVKRRLTQTKRAMFMTGTPMENRLSEFQRLANLLDPSISGRMPAINARSTEQFRNAAALIYLRRNQEDVLPELPDLIEVDEWLSFTGDDHLRFEEALDRSGNFIPLRYAAFPNGHRGGRSAKLDRLVELVAEARESGLKVAIYSEYHATIEAVVSTLESIDCPVFGPITGAVSPQQRLEMISDLTAYPGGAALVAQIQAGGIGLNIQAASVVILCEPALKPSIEVQAIARSFRMGQTRVVRVHRLLTEEGIDQRIRALLDHKQAEFDEYVRHSTIAESSEAAMERELVGSLTAYAAEEAARREVAG